MDSEFKKLLAGASWAETGDRVDMNDASIQPTIDRSEGYSVDFSTDTTPTRARINQILRELTGAAKEVVRGVSAYDAEVDYPQGSICQANGDLYYAVVAHNASSPVNPLTLGQTTWATIAGRGQAERTVPAEVPSANIFIDGERADRFQVWWYTPDNGGHPILQSQVRWAKDINFNNGSQTTGTPGFERTISTHDSDLFYVSVRSRNQLGWSPWSSAKRVRNSPVLPGNINFMRAEGSGQSGVTNVYWTRPEDNGLDISQFRVQWARETGQDFSTTERNMLVSVTDQTKLDYSQTITGLGEDHGFKFRVQAISNRNTTSPGGHTNAARAIGSNDVPSKPVISTEAVSATRARAWIDRTLNDGGYVIDYYEWSWRLRGSTGNWESDNTTTQTYIIKHDRGQLYDVRVRAHNTLGYGPYSDTAQIAAFVPSLPEPPAIAVRTSTTAVADAIKGVVSFSMGNMTRPEIIKDRIIQTAVRWAPSSGSTWTELNGTSYPNVDDNNFTIEQVFPATGDLGVNQELNVQARWRNSRGWSNWSPSVVLGEVLPPDATLVLSPTSLSVIEDDSTTMSIKLSRIPLADTTVSVTSSSDDLTISPASLTFTTDNWDTNQTITITAETDANEVSDTATLTLRTTGGLNISDTTVNVTIYEPLILVGGFSSGSAAIPKNTPPIFQFPLQLSGEPSSDVTVTATITDSDTTTITPSTFSFTPSNWKNFQQVQIGYGSSSSEDDEPTISFAASGGATSGFFRNLTFAAGETRVSIDTSINSVLGKGLTRRSGGSNIEGGIKLNRIPAGTFTLNIKPLRPEYISVSPTSMTFTRQNWNSWQSVAFTSSSNAPFPAREAIMLEPQGTRDIEPTFIQIFVVDTLVPSGGGSAYVIPEGNYIRASVELGSPVSSDVTITPTSTNANITFSPASTTITAGNTYQNATFNIRAASDADNTDGSATIVYTATGGVSATKSISALIAEPTNTLITTATNGRIEVPVSDNGLYREVSVGFTLMSEPPSNVTVSDNYVSGSVLPTSPSTIAFFPSNYNVQQTKLFRWNRNSFSGAVYDLRPFSSDSSISIPIQRITFVAAP